ncbi:MAG TPA: alpha/beta hydrolase [Ktedonobacteraceae bacterium]
MRIGKEHLQSTTCVACIERHTLSYRVMGQGSPLVLIHGFGVSGQIWQPILPYLAQQHRIYVLDLPGYGRSTFTPPWRLREMAPLLLTWLRELNLSSVALMGQSMGGAIALHLSALAPELIERVVLVSSAGIPLNASLSTLFWRSLLSTLQPGNGSYPWGLIRDVLRPRPVLFWQNTLEMAQSDFRVEIADLKIPALIIWGERDLLLPISLGQTLHAALPHATFVTFCGCGHRPMLAHPERLSALALDFLAKDVVSRASPGSHPNQARMF